MFRYPTADELEPTEEERAAARKSAGAQQTASAWGSGIGTVLGGLAGLTPLLAGQPELLAATLPAGLSAGASIGNTVGGLVGGAEADKADKQLSEAELQRQKRLAELQLHDEALNRLYSTG